MAEIIYSGEFPTDDGRGAVRKYDWDNWLNGRYWKLSKGLDYENQMGLRASAVQAAKARNISVKVVQRDRGNTMYVCAFAGSGDAGMTEYPNQFDQEF